MIRQHINKFSSGSEKGVFVPLLQLSCKFGVISIWKQKKNVTLVQLIYISPSIQPPILLPLKKVAIRHALLGLRFIVMLNWWAYGGHYLELKNIKCRCLFVAGIVMSFFIHLTLFTLTMAPGGRVLHPHYRQGRGGSERSHDLFKINQLLCVPAQNSVASVA